LIPLNSGANPAARSVAVTDLQPVDFPTDSSNAAPIRIVKMNDDDPMYQPNSIRILAGQTIEWQNNGQVSHSVTDDPARANKPEDALLPTGVKPFNSGNVMPGSSFRHTFSQSGRYRYFCLTHETDKMVGEVIVELPAPPPERIAKSKPPTIPYENENSAENGNAAGAPVQIVRMHDDEPMYQPNSIQISAGQTVEWENDGQVSHSVTDDQARATRPMDALRPPGARPFNSGSVMPGGRFRHTFTRPGRYRYFCLAHEEDRMVGEVIVTPMEPSRVDGARPQASGDHLQSWRNLSDFSPDYPWGPR
jgi:plastocyanin